MENKGMKLYKEVCRASRLFGCCTHHREQQSEKKTIQEFGTVIYIEWWLMMEEIAEEPKMQWGPGRVC